MISRSQTSPRPGLSWVLLCAMMTVFCVAGGASRADVPGQAIVRGVAAGALVVVILCGERPIVGRSRPVFVLLAAAIALVLLQLVPLPPAVWSRLPARAVFEEANSASGGVSWRPLAIAPGSAINAALALLAPLATLVLLLGLSAAERRNVPGLLLCLMLASTLVATLQFSGVDAANPLVNQTRGDASGLFANRNHLALWLAQGCLLVPAWAFPAGRRSGWRGPAGVGLVLLFMLTILATGSRAGIMLGLLAFVVFAGLAYKGIRAELAHAPRWVATAAIAGVCASVAIVVVASIAAGRAVSIDRAFAIDAWQDIRNRALPTVLTMIGDYFPVGSGAGSFDAVFRLHEPFALLKPTYFNHAHNDFLEIVLDTGLPGMALLLAALVWWGRASVDAWRRAAGAQAMLPRIGSAMVLLAIVASLFDYPARTPLVMATIVIAAVWLCGRPDNRATPALPGQDHHL